MSNTYIFTSESVSEGHPDKMSDQISDAVVDAALAQDLGSRLGCETMVKSVCSPADDSAIEHHVILAGEITTNAQLDYDKIVRQTISDIGYVDDSLGFNAENVNITQLLNHQSADIAEGVDESTNEENEQGAGDQGLMFGFACDETPELMPLPIMLSHQLVQRQAQVRKSGVLDWLGPDAKSQVSIVYEGYKPVSIDTVVISTQHRANISQKDVHRGVQHHIIDPILPQHLRREKLKTFINPTGIFSVGGPQADCGLTGRKIIVDTYGGMARHGGGAFSGKDPSKVDRSAAYYARYLAKNIVAAGLAQRCEVQIAYAIGRAEPVSMMVDTFGTVRPDIDDTILSQIVEQNFALKPKMIIDNLGLLQPIYKQTAAYGHFGRSEFPWEQLDAVQSLQAEVDKICRSSATGG